MLKKVRCEYVVKGHVQGIGYREKLGYHAESLGLAGFAKNKRNGDVLVVVQGDEDIVDIFYEYLGDPPGDGKVSRIIEKKRETIEKVNLVGFRILWEKSHEPDHGNNYRKSP